MPLDPGGAQPSVRYVDRHVYYSGKAKTVVTRRERRGNVVYVYRTVYHHYKAPSGTGGGGNPPSPSKPARRPGAGDSILAKQRLLRAAGYRVVLDGIWGPRSQNAWRAYQRRRGGITTAPGDAAREAAQLRQLNRRAATSRALIDAKANAAKARTLTMQRSIQGLKDSQIQRGRLGHLAPSPRIDRRSERFGVVLEEQRRALHSLYIPGGEEQIAGQIFRLGQLLNDPRTRSRTLRGMSAANLRTYLFDPVFGNYKNFPAARNADGSIPRSPHVAVLQGWLNHHGEKVRRDGVLDADTLRALGREMVALERRERREAIADIIDQFYGGSGEKTGPGYIREGAAINLEGLPGFRAHQIPTPGELLDALQRNDVVSRRLLRALYRRLSVQQLAALRAKYLKADVTAKIEFQASREIVAQMERDANDGGFFATILDKWDAAVDHTRAAVLAGYEVGKEAVVEDKMKFWTSDFWMSDEDISEEALARIRHFDNEHVYLGLLTQILADPANLIPGKWFLMPFRLTGRGAKGASAFLEAQGFKLSENGRLLAIPSKALQVPAKSLRVPANVREGFWAGQLAGSGGIGDDLIAGIIQQSRNATRLLSDTKFAAHMRTTEHLRRGLDADWLPKPIASAGKSIVTRAAPKIPREILDEYQDAFRIATSQAHIPAEGTLSDMVNLRVSLYANSDKSVLSDFGAILDANLGATLRRDAIRDLAEERAVAARRAFSVRDKRPESLRAEYERVFDKTIEGAGPYGYYGDPEIHAILLKRVNFQLRSIRERWFPVLQARTEMALDELGLSLWDESGKWSKQEIGDYLRAVGSDMFADKNLIELDNPMYGRHFGDKDALRFQEAEERMRTTQKEAWYARRKAAGDDPGEEWVEREVKAIHDEIARAWKETPEGLFTDTRKTLKVSFAYASHYADLIGGKLDIFANQASAAKFKRLAGSRTYKSKLTDLALPPGQRSEGLREVHTGDLTEQLRHQVEPPSEDEFFEAIDEFEPVLTPKGDPIVPKVEVSSAQLDVNRIASYFRFARDADDVPVDFWKEASEFLSEADIDLKNFQGTMERFEKAYSAAYESAQAQALAREGAFYTAMRYSQHAPLRGLWTSTQAWLGIWRFLALPMRPGWAVINHIDNSVKALLNGLVNPKHWFRAMTTADGKPLTVFEMQWDEIRASSRFLDSIAGTRMGATLDAAFERFWALPQEVHRRVFRAHGFDFPTEMLDAAALASEGGTFVKRNEDLAKILAEGGSVSVSQKALASLASFHDRVWTLMGTRPENFTKKALYSSTRERALKKGASQLDSHLLAWKAVDDTLFDYSKISTLEDNLRVFFPFVQFARKNAEFWVKQAARRPVLALNLIDGYSEARQQMNADLPEWMQRYAVLRWVSDLAAKDPALAWLAGPLSEAATDPVNIFSFKSFYRLVKSENEILPSERDADNLFNSMIEFLEDVGFSMNPLVRKPLEIAGALSLRSWQSVFPQTALIEAFTRKHFSERFPNGVNLERMFTDKILTLIGEEPTADHAAANFNTYVQMEMAAQAHRGDPVDRAAAEKKIRDFLYVQTLLGYFGGIYIRHMSPEDIYYSQLADAMRRGEKSFLELSPQERANYRLWKNRTFDRTQFDQYVDQLPLVRAYYAISSYTEARKFLRENPQILPYVEERFGRGNDGLPGYVAEKELQAQTEIAIRMFDLIDKAELDPDTVKLAEQLLVTKELREYWALNDTPDEIRIQMLRGQYFRRMNALNKGYHALPDDDFDARKGYLEEHPELQRYWDSNDTESDAVRGVLLATLADLRESYFEYVEEGDWDGARAFLEAFPFTFDKLIDGTYTADRTTGRGGGGGGGLSAHARDYLANRVYLDHYFDLPKSARSAWLNSGSLAANAVKAYFDRWGSGGSNFNGADFNSPLLRGHNAELASRLRFWRRYWALPPSKRERFIAEHGEEAGIFIYGLLSAREQNDRRQEWMRRAFLAGLTPRAAAYLYVKPLLDFFAKLTRKQKQLFLRANPELQWYFDNFVDKSITGDPKLDKLLERYFDLLPGSLERAQFLQKHPEVQDYFDSKSTPEERALRNLLEKYFEITNPDVRREFLMRHPEIREYFDKRKRERDRESEVLGAFDDADPRLDGFREGAAFEADSVERMLERLRRKSPDKSISTRRDRRPQES